MRASWLGYKGIKAAWSVCMLTTMEAQKGQGPMQRCFCGRELWLAENEQHNSREDFSVPSVAGPGETHGI